MFEQRSPSTPDFSDEQVHVGLAQRIVASHTEHAAAEQTVASLVDAGFPADRAAIVGSGLQLHERGQGQLSTADVTGRGALSGVIVGVLVGWLLALFDVMTPELSTLWLAVNAGILGAVLGATVALLGYVFTRGHRWFTHPIIRAQRYEVMVDADAADEAVRTLQGNDSTDRRQDASPNRALHEPRDPDDVRGRTSGSSRTGRSARKPEEMNLGGPGVNPR